MAKNAFIFPVGTPACLIAFAVLATCALAAAQQRVQQNNHGDIQLLEGYSIKYSWAVDAHARTIEKKDGLRIEFEAGPSEGFWANPKDQQGYDWYREQVVNGYKVRVALTKTDFHTCGTMTRTSNRVGYCLSLTSLGERNPRTRRISAPRLRPKGILGTLC